MKTQKALSFILKTVTVISLLSVFSSVASVEAAKEIALGTSGLAKNNFIYLGKDSSYNQWRIVSMNGNDDSDDCIFLMSEYVVAKMAYDEDEVSNEGQTGISWYKSDIYTWLNDEYLKERFSKKQAAMFKSTSKRSDVMGVNYSNELTGEKIFLLSKYEASTLSSAALKARETADGALRDWWLRDPTFDGKVNVYMSLRSKMELKQIQPSSNAYVRPALNLCKDNILFTFPYCDVKSANVGTLSKNADYTKKKYNLTVYDINYRFRIAQSSVIGTRGDRFTLNYTCFRGNRKDVSGYISVMIVDADNNVLYYGQLAECIGEDSLETGYLDFTIPDDLADGEYTLKFFNEDMSVNKDFNYASNLYDVYLSVRSENNVVLGTSVLRGGQKSNVYFGEYKQSINMDAAGFNTDPIKWNVLDTAFKYDNEKDGILLLSDKLLDEMQYNESYTSVTWETSSVRRWLNGTDADSFYGTAFSDVEKKAVLDTTVKNNDRYISETKVISGGNDTTDKVFLLSIDEYENNGYFLHGGEYAYPTQYYEDKDVAYSTIESGRSVTQGTVPWWLRSGGSLNDTALYMCTVSDRRVDTVLGIRPLFNLDPTSVLFTTAAVGGKASDVGLFENGINTTGEYKLTVADSARAAFTAKVTGISENQLTVSYSNAVLGENEYISAILVNAAGEVIRYGKLAEITGESGTVTLDLTGFSLSVTDKLYVFNEQINGDYKTDYSSELKELTTEIALTKDKVSVWLVGRDKAELIVASYKGKALKDAKIVPIKLRAYESSFTEIGLDTTDADSVKAYLWTDTGTLVPLCEAQEVTFSQNAA